MQVRVLPGSFYFLALINKDLCNVASLAAATATSIAVIDIRGFDLGGNWKQCAFAEARAAIAQLGERQTEDLKVPGSIPGLGIFADPGSVQNTILCCSCQTLSFPWHAACLDGIS